MRQLPCSLLVFCVISVRAAVNNFISCIVFPAPSLNSVIKNVVLISAKGNKICGPRITADWNCGEPFAACRWQNGLSEVVRPVELCRLRHVHGRVEHSDLPEGF